MGKGGGGCWLLGKGACVLHLGLRERACNGAAIEGPVSPARCAHL